MKFQHQMCQISYFYKEDEVMLVNFNRVHCAIVLNSKDKFGLERMRGKTKNMEGRNFFSFVWLHVIA